VRVQVALLRATGRETCCSVWGEPRLRCLRSLPCAFAAATKLPAATICFVAERSERRAAAPLLSCRLCAVCRPLSRRRSRKHATGRRGVSPRATRGSCTRLLPNACFERPAAFREARRTSRQNEIERITDIRAESCAAPPPTACSPVKRAETSDATVATRNPKSTPNQPQIHVTCMAA